MTDKRWDFTNPVDIAEDFARGNWTHVNDTSELHQWSGERCGEISATVLKLNDENAALKAEIEELEKCPNESWECGKEIRSLRSRVEELEKVAEAARNVSAGIYPDRQGFPELEAALAALDKK